MYQCTFCLYSIMLCRDLYSIMFCRDPQWTIFLFSDRIKTRELSFVITVALLHLLAIWTAKNGCCGKNCRTNRRLYNNRGTCQVLFRQFVQYFNHFFVRRFVYSYLNGVLMLKFHACTFNFQNTGKQTKKSKTVKNWKHIICDDLPTSFQDKDKH